MTARGLELEIGGMTCASCANRIEKKLNKLDGVTVSVNLATEKGHVEYPPERDVEEILATVRRMADEGTISLSGNNEELI